MRLKGVESDLQSTDCLAPTGRQSHCDQLLDGVFTRV